MTGRNAGTSTPSTHLEALRQIWQADKYPIRGNEDWRHAAILDKEALDRAATAVASPNDIPEFAMWITALLDPQLPNNERERIMSALHDLFDPDPEVK